MKRAPLLWAALLAWGCADDPAASSAVDAAVAVGDAAVDVGLVTDMRVQDSAPRCTPGEETCDGTDEDCDGTTDEGVTRGCHPGPIGVEGVGACVEGTQTCSAGAWGTCAGAGTPVEETCDGTDEDCDGAVDEDVLRACYGGPAVTENVGICVGGVETCSGGEWGACEGEQTPREETCNSLDDDCDGMPDDALVRACYSGEPLTIGVGPCKEGRQTCGDGIWAECAGEVTPTEEICDGLDQDCDGLADEGLPLTWPDGDGDGFGDAAAMPECIPGEGRAEVGGDCDDEDAEVHPDAFDDPDLAFVDANCDGVDGDLARLLFVDVEAIAAGANGSPERPFASLGDALRAAQRDPQITGLAFSAGIYEEQVEVRDGVGLYGGYEREDGWNRAQDHTVTFRHLEVEDGRVVAARAHDLVEPTALQLLTLEAGPNEAPRGTVYGLHVRAAPTLRLEQVTVLAGRGGPGRGGVDGEPGGHGTEGNDGGFCGGPPGGGGDSPCGAHGGDGGLGGAVRENGRDGEGCGGAGGVLSGGGAGSDGVDGCSPPDPGDGAHGEGAVAGEAIDGWWRPGRGADGQDGPNGTPGGGGGGGSGAAVIGGRAGAGGGGGAAGCGGGAGTGGEAGGGSFALFVVDSTGLVIVRSTFTSGAGGDGGPGGAGATGGNGAVGGDGGGGREAFACGGLAGPGAGGNGGTGADGGDGGHGEGGPGGPSHPVYCVGTALDLEDAFSNPGPAGQPGGGPGAPGALGSIAPSVGCVIE